MGIVWGFMNDDKSSSIINRGFWHSRKDMARAAGFLWSTRLAPAWRTASSRSHLELVTVCYGKSPFLVGKSANNGPFQWPTLELLDVACFCHWKHGTILEEYGKYGKTGWKIGIENDYCRFYVVGRIYFVQDIYSTVGVHHGASPKRTLAHRVCTGVRRCSLDDWMLGSTYPKNR